jgi:ABC-2 type transport system ATP-binding protein
MSAIRLLNVRKEYGRKVALHGLSLDVPAGVFLGLIGHNGAGKSTALKLLTGLVAPTSGQVWVDGLDLGQDPLAARRVVGAVPEEPAVYPWLTGREFLEYVAEVRGGDLSRALSIADLGPDADRLIREYSQGMRRRTALAAALLGSPKVLVLDESLNGLDPPAAARVKRLLRETCDAGATVVLSTHLVDTVQSVADRVVMLAHGRLVADEQVADLPAGGLERLFLERLESARQAGLEASSPSAP